MTDDKFWNELEIQKAVNSLLKAHDKLAEANRFVQSAEKRLHKLQKTEIKTTKLWLMLHGLKQSLAIAMKINLNVWSAAKYFIEDQQMKEECCE